MNWFLKIWHKYLLGTQQPWAIEEYDTEGSLIIKDYNYAYLKDIRSRLPDEMVNAMNNRQIIQLWIDRYNHEHVEPKLEVVHAGIDENGNIKMKLDWNHMFIKLLRKQNIPGDTEEELVENYLMMVTRAQREDAISDDLLDVTPEEVVESPTLDDQTAKRLERATKRRANNYKKLHSRELDK